jgi:hypothetical protein
VNTARVIAWIIGAALLAGMPAAARFVGTVPV